MKDSIFQKAFELLLNSLFQKNYYEETPEFEFASWGLAMLREKRKDIYAQVLGTS